MPKKTFLELTNEVGKNVRLSDGSTWTALGTDFNQVFIQQMINEAKRTIEGERQWNILQQTVTFDSAPGTFTYDTSDLLVVTSDPVVTNERSQIVEDETSTITQFWDLTDTSGSRLARVSRNQVVNRRRLDNGQSDQVENAWFAAYSNGNGLTIEFPYAPSDVRNYTFEAYTPEDDLSLAADEMTVPWRPVVLLATALVAEERGEELGLNASTWYERADSALSEAIVIDMLGDAPLDLVPA